MAPSPEDYPSPTTAGNFQTPPFAWPGNPYSPKKTGTQDSGATDGYNLAHPAATSGSAAITSSGSDAELTVPATIIISSSNPWKTGASDSSSRPQGVQHHHSPIIVTAAGAVVALVAISLAILCCYLTYRKKKRQHRNAATAAQTASRGGIPPEMKTVAAHVARPPYIRQPADARSQPLALQSSASATSSSQPVILSTTMDQSYYTGIDTSDHVSLAQSLSSTETYVEGADEPPPPYRPRSVPPISREASLRTSNSIAHRNSVRRSRDLIRSPFDDPEEEDVSDLEEPPSIRRVEADQLSAVSDLSYQQEPTTTHSTV